MIINRVSLFLIVCSSTLVTSLNAYQPKPRKQRLSYKSSPYMVTRLPKYLAILQLKQGAPNIEDAKKPRPGIIFPDMIIPPADRSQADKKRGQEIFVTHLYCGNEAQYIITELDGQTLPEFRYAQTDWDLAKEISKTWLELKKRYSQEQKELRNKA